MNDETITTQTKSRPRRNPTRKGQHYRMSAEYRNFCPSDVLTMPKRKLNQLWMQFAFPLSDGKPYCPRCGSLDHTLIQTRGQYRCRGCEHRYSKTSGTIFACRKLAIRQILFGIAEFQDEEDGRAAHSLARKIGVTYKTAWVMGHKIRQLMVAARRSTKISEDVAVDGAYFGGSIRNANILKKRNDHRKGKFRDGNRKKVIVVIKGRIANSTILASEFSTEAAAVEWVRSNVPENVKIFTDEGNHWTKLGLTHKHETINHTQAYKLGDNDTNTAESFFSTLRVASRLYRSISRNYFTAYINEQVWRRTAKVCKSNLDRFFNVANWIGQTKSSFRGYWQYGASVK